MTGGSEVESAPCGRIFRAAEETILYAESDRAGRDALTGRSEVKGTNPVPSCVRAKGTVHIRSGPGTRYECIGTSKKGETFPLLGTRDGWHRIGYGDAPEAWITGKTKYTELTEG